MLKHKYTRWYLLTFVLALVGCGTSRDEEQQQAREIGSRLSPQSPLLGVAALRLQRGGRALLKDEPASRTYSDVAAARLHKVSLHDKFAIYELSPPVEPMTEAVQRAQNLFGARSLVSRGEPDKDVGVSDALRPWIFATLGQKNLRINGFSGDESYEDAARNHKGAPVDKLPLSDDEYVSRAESYMSTAGGLVGRGIANNTLFPYKLRRYMVWEARPNEIASAGRAYQVAVAYNQTVDDLPVIGTGGKFSVHLSPQGEVVGHEINLRSVKRVLARISEGDLVSPEDALAQVEARLTASGLDLTQFTLVRNELGYYRFGRNSPQSVLAPHYAFGYDPRPGVTAKRLLEVVPATRNQTHLGWIAADQQADQDRKDKVMAAGGGETVKGVGKARTEIK